jgi:hypothetical protein
MKKIFKLQASFALLLAAAPLAATADTFFSDNFANGSTINSATPVSPTANSASYETVSSQPSCPGTPTITANDLRFGLTNANGGNICEIQAIFATNAIALVAPGDYIQLTIVFTNFSGIYCSTVAGALTGVGFGLYNSGQVFPMAGGMNGTEGTGTASGGVQNWAGYMAFVTDTTSSLHNEVFARPSNASNGNSDNQDLVTQGSSSKSFSNNGGTVIGSAGPTLVPATTNVVYTNILTITLIGTSQLAITNNLYGSAGLVTSIGGTNSAAAFTAVAFDGLAMGFYKKSDPAGSPSNLVDVASITVSGSVTVISGPPTITLQPLPVTVPNGAACAFIVNAQGFNTTYQWHRNGTNLDAGDNISVVNSADGSSSLLVVSPAGPADVLSGANGYYVTVTGAGPYSTNSVTNSLAFTTATNLIFNPPGTEVWDLNTSANWNDTNGDTGLYFNYGDPVTFNDVEGGGGVRLTGPYLSAASVTVNSSALYNFLSSSSGSFAGPGYLLYEGAGQLTISNANTYSGGTIISNASAHLLLGNLNGLGTGPVTLALAGGNMEIAPSGGGNAGIASDFIVADDFTIIVDATNTTTGVLLNGNLSGTSNKTLTITHNPTLSAGTNATRIRIFGTNTAYNANLVLGAPGDTNIVWAPYQASGSQTYNGVISGPGAMIHRGTITYFNGANTYSGGMNLAAGVIGLGIDSSPTTGTVVSGPIGTGPLLMTEDSSSSTTGSGEVFASGGARTIANSIQFPNGTNNLTLIIGGANNLTLSGAFTLNGNDGRTTNTITARTLQVTNTGLTTISGVISDGGLAYGLVVTGNGSNAPGPLALNNTETYTGPTTVTNAATLQVNGSLNALSAVTVSTNATLAGTGTINGAVTISAGGTLAPGTGSIGTLAINNNLTLNGNLLFKVNKSLSPSQSNDVASVNLTLANGGTGTLTVTNLGPALVAGDRFVLFNKGLSGGGALTVTGGGAGVTWNNNLVSDGSISVASVSSAPKPVITSTILNGANLILNGTNGTASAGGTFYVLSSTNVAAPLSAWTSVSTNTYGTGGAFSVTNAIVPGVPNNFYMLKQ